MTWRSRVCIYILSRFLMQAVFFCSLINFFKLSDNVNVNVNDKNNNNKDGTNIAIASQRKQLVKFQFSDLLCARARCFWLACKVH